MSTHIRRDGGMLCGLSNGLNRKQEKRVLLIRKEQYIDFNYAHKLKMDGKLLHICSGCRKRYFEILSKIPEAVVVGGKVKARAKANNK